MAILILDKLSEIEKSLHGAYLAGAECSFCGKPLPQRGPVVYWMLIDTQLVFDPECANKFQLRLARDVWDVFDRIKKGAQ